METDYAKSPIFWHRFAWAMLTAVITGVSVLLYVIVVKGLAHLIWPVPFGYEPFSGSWLIVVIMTAIGLLVGLIHRYLKAKELDAIDAISEGQLPPEMVPGSTLVSIASLAGGFSLGPEVPSGVLAAGLATWVSDRRGLDEETRQLNVFSGVMSAYAGIFASATAILLAAVELPHKQSLKYFGTILITTLAAVVGYIIFVLATPLEFTQSISLLNLPTYDLDLWHILLGIILGIVGVAFALVFGILLRLFGRLAAPLQTRPIIRGGIGGLLIGLLSFALPVTMFYGSDQLVVITEQATEIGVVLLLVFAFAKIVVTTGALATGFIGGPIFPLFFVGGAIGLALHLMFPQIPVALAVACLMAAIPSALLSIPLTLAVIVLFLAGIPVAEAIPVILAALTAHFITHGLGLLGQARAQQEKP